MTRRCRRQLRDKRYKGYAAPRDDGDPEDVLDCLLRDVRTLGTTTA